MSDETCRHGLNLKSNCEECNELIWLRASVEQYRELHARAAIERDKAESKAKQYEQDWYEAKSEFGDAMGKARARIRELDSALRDVIDDAAPPENNFRCVLCDTHHTADNEGDITCSVRKAFQLLGIYATHNVDQEKKK